MSGGAPWMELGAVAPTDLGPARLEAHAACQVLAALGGAYASSRPDDSHRAMRVEPAGRRLLGERLSEADAPVRGALRLGDLTLELVEEGAQSGEELRLSGRTLEQAFAWIGSRVGPLALPEYELPPSPVLKGSPFGEAARASADEIALWFGHAAIVLERLCAGIDGTGPVRCWPHHLDIATLIVAGPEQAPASRTIGVGLSPGDESFAEPYWYASPWPRPDAAPKGALAAGGVWYDGSFLAAILTGSELVAGSTSSQPQRVETFLSSALEAFGVV